MDPVMMDGWMDGLGWAKVVAGGRAGRRPPDAGVVVECSCSCTAGTVQTVRGGSDSLTLL